MSAFAKDKEFHSAHTIRPVENLNLKGTLIEIPVLDKKAKAYWVAPRSGTKTSILMIHEWWGLNDHIKQTADEVQAKTGYGVLAIDLYEGKVAKTPDEAGKFMGSVDQKLASATVNAALRAIQQGIEKSPGATKVGTIGFCFGGGWSHKAAIMGGDKVQACVIFYGMPTTAPGELERLKAPVLMVWGKKDKWINESVVTGFQKAMDHAQKSLQVEGYDADHAFANPTSKSYESEASKNAWAKAYEFFKKYLG